MFVEDERVQQNGKISIFQSKMIEERFAVLPDGFD
jgi:hypothetical protein